MSFAALIRDMAAAGAPPEAIALAVEAIEQRDVKGAELRGKAAARKRAQRDRERDSHATVTATSQDKSHETSPPLPPLPSPQTPLPTPPISPPPSTKPGARAVRLPDDWQPQPLAKGTAEIVAVWEPGRMERELAKFRDWAAAASGPNSRKPNWDAAWRNWLREADERHGNSSRNRGGNPGAGHPAGHDRTRSAAAAFRSHLEGGGSIHDPFAENSGGHVVAHPSRDGGPRAVGTG